MPRASRRLRAIAWRTRSTNSARLGSPVTGSWNAWWASWRSKALRSLTSRQLRTMPPTCSSSSRLVSRTSNWRVRAVLVAQRALAARAPATGASAPSAISCSRRAALGLVHEVVDAAADDLLGRPAEHAARSPGSGRRGRVGPEHGDEVAGVLDQRGEARLALRRRDLLGERGALEGERRPGAVLPARRTPRGDAHRDTSRLARGSRRKASQHADSVADTPRSARLERPDDVGVARRREQSLDVKRAEHRAVRAGAQAVEVGAGQLPGGRRRQPSSSSSRVPAATSAAPARASARSRSIERSWCASGPPSGRRPGRTARSPRR